MLKEVFCVFAKTSTARNPDIKTHTSKPSIIQGAHAGNLDGIREKRLLDKGKFSTKKRHKNISR